MKNVHFKQKLLLWLQLPFKNNITTAFIDYYLLSKLKEDCKLSDENLKAMKKKFRIKSET